MNRPGKSINWISTIWNRRRTYHFSPNYAASATVPTTITPRSYLGCRLNKQRARHLEHCMTWKRAFGPVVSAAENACYIQQTRLNSTSNKQSGPSFSHPKSKSPPLSSNNQTCSPPLPIQFLEAHNDQKFDPSTHQRNDVPFHEVNGKPPLSLPNSNDVNRTEHSWKYDASSDNWCLLTKTKTQQMEDSNIEDDRKLHSCRFSNQWVRSQVNRWHADPSDFDTLWPGPQKNKAEKSNPINSTPRDLTKRVLWSGWTESMVRDPAISPILVQYDQLVGSKDNPNHSESSEKERLLKAFYQYGLVLITGTPTHTDSLPEEVMNPESVSHMTSEQSNDSKVTAESAILHLASIIGYHPLQTLYGSGVWSTSSYSSFYNDKERNNDMNTESTSTADSAYGSTSLPLHTDMTYMTNPPGVQVFLMVQPASSSETTSPTNNETGGVTAKGQSIYLDGFAAAQQLLKENPNAFHLLATTPREYRCVDDQEGWHLEARGSVIDVNPRWKKLKDKQRSDSEWDYEWGPVKAIRHNDLDRLPDLPPLDVSEHDSFYHNLKEAHNAWNDILSQDDMRLVINLQPGDCVLVANQRVMHGRYAFETSAFPRVVMGCYVGMDELSSKWRRSGFRVL